MDARARFILLLAGAAGLLPIAMVFVTVLTVQDVMSKVTPNTGSLVWPLAVPILVFAYGAVIVCVVVSLTSIATAALNECGFFSPWPRGRLRFWSITTFTVAALAAAMISYPFFPTVRPAVDRLIGL